MCGFVIEISMTLDRMSRTPCYPISIRLDTFAVDISTPQRLARRARVVFQAAIALAKSLFLLSLRRSGQHAGRGIL